MVAAAYGDFLGLASFGLGIAFLATAPSSSETVFDKWTKGFSIASLAVFVCVLAIDVTSYFALNERLESLEGYIEMLFPVLAVLAIFSAHRQQQLLDLRGAQRALRSSFDMMLTIVDGAPAGIVLLDDLGRISFANEVAKDVLDLVEDPTTGAISTPGWSVVESGRDNADARLDFSGVAHALVERVVPLSLTWPNGWRIELRMSGAALADSAGGGGGIVASFERPQMR